MGLSSSFADFLAGRKPFLSSKVLSDLRGSCTASLEYDPVRRVYRFDCGWIVPSKEIREMPVERVKRQHQKIHSGKGLVDPYMTSSSAGTIAITATPGSVITSASLPYSVFAGPGVSMSSSGLTGFFTTGGVADSMPILDTRVFGDCPGEFVRDSSILGWLIPCGYAISDKLILELTKDGEPPPNLLGPLRKEHRNEHVRLRLPDPYRDEEPESPPPERHRFTQACLMGRAHHGLCKFPPRAGDDVATSLAPSSSTPVPLPAASPDKHYTNIRADV